MIVEDSCPIMGCDLIIQHDLDGITKFSIIGKVVIKFTCNTSNVDIGGVM